MWALRRASAYSIKARGLNLAAFRACAGLGPLSSHTEDKSGNSEHCGFALVRGIQSTACQCAVRFPNQFTDVRSFSLHAGAKSGGEEEDALDEGFSELETPEASETVEGGDGVNDSSSDSESELSSADESLEEETVDFELMKDGGVTPSKKVGTSPLLKLILDESGPSISDALDNYAAKGQDLSRAQFYYVMLNMRRRKMFLRALQLSEWLEKREDFEYTKRDYASRVDLIAKVRGLREAENYIDSIPKSMRQELVYRTLLANSVSVYNMAKSEEIFNKMRDLGFLISAFTCNQLLVLYKRTAKGKIADVLLFMEKYDIKPTLFTYQLLIDTKGRVNDLVGMEQVVETMQAEGIKPNAHVQATLARHYAMGGLNKKAEAVLKEIEGVDLKSNRGVCPTLLSIYGILGKADEVERVWTFCESKPRQVEYLAAIEAWGKLKNVEKAEALYQKMKKSVKKLYAMHYTAMLKVYAENKMLIKGKQLLKQMGGSGCHIGPFAWDAFVKLYVDAGEVEKADSVLQKAVSVLQKAALRNPQRRPMFSSYILILDQYAKRGDVHNAEKIFLRMRQAGYVSRSRAWFVLLQAYINGNVPAYGFTERLKADNVFPNQSLARQLARVDAFNKTAVSDLLD